MNSVPLRCYTNTIMFHTECTFVQNTVIQKKGQQTCSIMTSIQAEWGIIFMVEFFFFWKFYHCNICHFGPAKPN